MDFIAVGYAAVMRLSERQRREVSDVISVRAAKLTAGDGPDIFAAGADTHFQEFAEKGVLEDLKPYIEADLQEEEYLTELLYAYERDGKVYAIETEFQS